CFPHDAKRIVGHVGGGGTETFARARVPKPERRASRRLGEILRQPRVGRAIWDLLRYMCPARTRPVQDVGILAPQKERRSDRQQRRYSLGRSRNRPAS